MVPATTPSSSEETAPPIAPAKGTAHREPFYTMCLSSLSHTSGDSYGHFIQGHPFNRLPDDPGR